MRPLSARLHAIRMAMAFRWRTDSGPRLDADCERDDKLTLIFPTEQLEVNISPVIDVLTCLSHIT